LVFGNRLAFEFWWAADWLLNFGRQQQIAATILKKKLHIPARL